MAQAMVYRGGRFGRADLLHAAVSALAVAFLTWIALVLTPAGASPLWWPASGAAVAAVATARRGARLPMLGVVLAGSLLGNVIAGTSTMYALAFAVGNTAEAAVASWWLLRGIGGIPRLDTVRDLSRLVVAAALGAIVGATVGMTLMATAGLGDPPLVAWVHLLASDASAIVLIVALFCRQDPSPAPASRGEMVAQLLAVMIVLGISFGPASGLPIGFSIVVPLVWGAVRTDPRWVVGQLVAVLALVLFLTAQGLGPFADAQARSSLEYLSFTLSQLFVIAVFLLVTSLALMASHQRQLLARVTDSERLLRAGFNDSLVGTALVRRKGSHLRVAEANRVARDLLGIPHDLPIERMDWLARIRTDRAHVATALASVLDGEVPYWRGEFEMSGSDGRPQWVEAAAAPLAGEDLVVMHLVDATARKIAESTAEHLALFDPVTGLPNRSLVHDRLTHALVTAEAAGDPVAVLLLDLDDFKQVNDAVGPPGGDQVLATVAHRLSSAVREIDTVARLGGDEFAVILPGVDAAVARERAEELLDEIRRPIDIGPSRQRVTASLGIVTSRPGCTAADLLGDADTAMYAAKRRGRDRAVHVDETQRDRALAAARALSELDTALERGDIVLHAQPIVRLADGRVHAAELLVRWEHPTQGLMPPATWLPHVSQGAHGRRLERWILQEACRIAATWQRLWGESAPRAHVNVSTGLLDGGDLAEQVLGAMAAYRLPAPAIVLELTEHDLEGVRDGLAHELQQVRAAGVRLAVDDFGTGYSSFSRLSELPLDELKIDHLFTSRMLHDPRSQEVVSAILRLATSLGLDTVAEGVESPEQVAALIDVGCTHGQGYLWSPAVPPEEFVALVEAWRPRVP